MVSRSLASRRPVCFSRLFFLVTLGTLLTSLNGCVFFIDHLTPDHGNAGDRVALRNPDGVEPLPTYLQVMFRDIQSQTILWIDPEEIVVEVPAGIVGDVPVSVWLGWFLVSNIKSFRADAVPIVYRIIAFGDSLVGPWVYHPQKLDLMLNENVGPSLVINEGKAGELLAQGAERLGRVLTTHAGVEYIYFLEGANDVSDVQNTPLAQMIASLDQMVDLAKSQFMYPIVLTLPPRTGNALLYDRTSPTTEEYNQALRQYVLSNRLDWIDLYQAFMSQPNWESFLDEEGLHLSADGQDFVAQTVYSTVAPLLQ
jgi:lysophospholipase L1-like esterase